MTATKRALCGSCVTGWANPVRRVIAHLFDWHGRITPQLKRRAASGADNTSGGSDLHQIQPGRRLVMSILSSDADKHAQARATLFETAPIIHADVDHHWYVDSHDYPGFCAACNTPRRNRRHTTRWVAA